MEKFIKKTLGFLLLLFVSISIYFYFIEVKSDYRELIGHETYHSLIKAKAKKKKVKKLIIGDSIANQAYNNESYNDSIYSLACNQGVSLVGHYIMLKTFLAQHEDNTNLEVFLLYRPSSFRNDLDQSYTFNYFLKPFYKKIYLDDITEFAINQIEKIPHYYLVNIPWVRSSRWAPQYSMENNQHDFRLSNISIEYLNKIESLCKQYNVKSLKIYCPFMSNQFGFEDFADFDKQVKDNNLSALFSGYYDKVVFIDKEAFMDGSHLYDPEKQLPYNYLNL